MASMLAPEFLTHWRTTIVRDREIVEAVVRPEHLGPSRALQAALANWPGMYYWASGADADRLVLVRIRPQRRVGGAHRAPFRGGHGHGCDQRAAQHDSVVWGGGG